MCSQYPSKTIVQKGLDSQVDCICSHSCFRSIQKDRLGNAVELSDPSVDRKISGCPEAFRLKKSCSGIANYRLNIVVHPPVPGWQCCQGRLGSLPLLLPCLQVKSDRIFTETKTFERDQMRRFLWRSTQVYQPHQQSKIENNNLCTKEYCPCQDLNPARPGKQANAL